MADLLTQLLQGALYKRAAIMEQWLANHKEHYPGPSIEVYNVDRYDRIHNDGMLWQVGRCSCGESIETTIIPSLTSVVTKKI